MTRRRHESETLSDPKKTKDTSTRSKKTKEGAVQKKYFERIVACQLVKKQLYSITYDDQSKYVGEVDGESRQRHGKGVFQTKSGDVMDGQWKDDRFHGFGTRVFAQNGDRHEGMYYKDKRHGRGTYLWKNGDKYIGEFYNGRMHGNGIFLSANGDTFEGTWFKGSITHGIKTLLNGDKIETKEEMASTWVDGFMTGEGIKYFRNGDVYHGHFEANVLSGFGVFRWANGDVYHGMWVCNQMQGIGRFESSSSSLTSRKDVYYGEFSKGQYNGQGRMEYASGAVYEGTFEANLRHGRGVYRWVDGEMYDGNWEKNLPSGTGFHLTEAFTYHGAWKDGYAHGIGLYACRNTFQKRRHAFEYGRAIEDASLVLERLCIV